MKDYKEISGENYCIQELECMCNECKNHFYDYMELNYELVCFRDEVGKKYFLPTYGKYGYLYLLEKLVDEWSAKDEISKKISDKFEKELNKFTQNKVKINGRVECPFCKKCNVSINKRNTIAKGPINWLKIDISNL